MRVRVRVPLTARASQPPPQAPPGDPQRTALAAKQKRAAEQGTTTTHPNFNNACIFPLYPKPGPLSPGDPGMESWYLRVPGALA